MTTPKPSTELEAACRDAVSNTFGWPRTANEAVRAELVSLILSIATPLEQRAVEAESKLAAVIAENFNQTRKLMAIDQAIAEIEQDRDRLKAEVSEVLASRNLLAKGSNDSLVMIADLKAEVERKDAKILEALNLWPLPNSNFSFLTETLKSALNPQPRKEI